MNFNYALIMLKLGASATRRKWNDPNKLVKLQKDKFVFTPKIKTAHHERVTLGFHFTTKDLLAEDWETIKNE